MNDAVRHVQRGDSGEESILWSVEPLPPAPVTAAERAKLKSSAGEGVGCGSAVAAVVVWIAVAAAGAPSFGFISGVVVAFVIFIGVSNSRYEQKLQDLERQRTAAARQEAEQLTKRLMTILAESELAFIDAERRQVTATNHLLRARQEFAATAYAPFWDAVERCASDFGAIRADLQTLTGHASTYSTSLRNRRHTFPVLRRTLPIGDDLKAVQLAFKDVVRQGQRDFQFAVIWEHRKTRDAIIAGFRTLGDAIDGIADAMYSTNASLLATLTDGFNSVVTGQQRSASAVTSRLDRIEGYASETAAAATDVRKVISRYRLLEE